jgi:hypothetical protein
VLRWVYHAAHNKVREQAEPVQTRHVTHNGSNLNMPKQPPQLASLYTSIALIHENLR